MTTETAVTEALAAEHAAIYAYGPVGALLTGARAELAREAEQAHRARRDQLLVLLAERGLAAPPAAPAYELPFQVANESDAMDLAMLVEERVSAVWRAALTDVDGTDRELVLTALVEAAVWATRWRLAAGVEPPTVAFPGET